MTVAIIGFGKMGKLYDRLLGASYIVDILPVYNRAYFSQLEEFIEYAPKIDIAIVATPTPSHLKCSKTLLVNGYNVLCEKPVCFSSDDAKDLETLALRKGLLFYQSTLERYNPVIKYFIRHIHLSEINYVESYRFGEQPPWGYTCDPLYDLGIHDVDLWFYLTRKKVLWRLQCGYGMQRREIIIYLKRKGKVILDLLNKSVMFNNNIVDLSHTPNSNPVVEMVKDLINNKIVMNELWSKEIEFIEQSKVAGFIELKPN